MHLDLHKTVSLARLAAAAFDVERESSRTVAANLRFGELGEQLANRREQARVRRRVGSRRPANRALVDVDHLVEVLESGDSLVRAGDHPRPIKMTRHRAVEDVLDERGLAAPGDAGDRDEESERNLDVEVPEVVLARALDADLALRVTGAPHFRDRNLGVAAQIFSGDRIRMVAHLVDGSGSDH